MDNTTSSLNMFDVQSTKNGSMATIAEKSENAFADESIFLLCTAIQDLKAQVCVLNENLPRYWLTTPQRVRKIQQ